MATDKPKTDTRVLAKAEEWRNSGVIVEKGKKYSIKAKGRWRHGPSCAWTGPDGIGAYTPLCWDLGGQIVTRWSHAALVAKIGEGGSPFGVGNEMELSPEETGALYFRINEGLGFNGDNEGHVDVSVSVFSAEERIKRLSINHQVSRRVHKDSER